MARTVFPGHLASEPSRRHHHRAVGNDESSGAPRNSRNHEIGPIRQCAGFQRAKPERGRGLPGSSIAAKRHARGAGGKGGPVDTPACARGLRKESVRVQLRVSRSRAFAPSGHRLEGQIVELLDSKKIQETDTRSTALARTSAAVDVALHVSFSWRLAEPNLRHGTFRPGRQSHIRRGGVSPP